MIDLNTVRVKIKQYFIIQELVPRHVYEERGEKAWELLDPRALHILYRLRETFGPVIVNDWHRGGNNQWRGFRSDQTPVGAKYSQHRYGRAFDCTLEKPAEEVRQYILAHPEEFPYLTTIEAETSWLHFDCRMCIPIKVVYP